MIQFDEWAKRWALPPEAMAELADIMGAVTEANSTTTTGDESVVQANARLQIANKKWFVGRNNNGACTDAKTGRSIRFGLFNDSKKVNEKLKSSDLIGLRPVLITPEMVGSIIGQFCAFEIKPSNWTYTGKGREVGQSNFIMKVNSLGGYARFYNGKGKL